MANFDSSNDQEFLLKLARFEENLKGEISSYFESSEIESFLDHYISKAQFLKALYACEYAIEKYPFNYDFLTTKAEVFIYLERINEALELLEYQIALGNTSANIFSLFGDAYLMKDEHNMALSYYKKALEVVYNDKEEMQGIYFDIAFVYQSMEQYTLGIKYLMKVLRMNPKHPDAINELGICIDLAEEYEVGIKHFEEVINMNPYSDMAWFYLGHCYTNLKLIEKAANAYEYAVIINDKNDLAQLAYADALFELDKYTDALEIYVVLEREGDTSETIYKKIGMCYYQLENIDEAKSYYNKGIKTCISEEFTDELWYLLGEAFEAEDNFTSAKKCYETALDKYDSEIYWAALANIEQELGNFEDALKFFENAVEGDPYNEALWEAYAYCLMDSGDIEASIATLESGLEIMPKSANLRYLLGATMIKRGHNQQGSVEIEKALVMNYNEHETIFEYFPEFSNNHDVLSLIERYKR